MQEPEQHYEVGRDHKGFSLLDFLDAVAGPVDRQAVRRASRDEHILVNGEPVGSSTSLRIGDAVDLQIAPSVLARTLRDRLTVLCRREGLLVADKPPGMPFDASRRGHASAIECLAGLLGAGVRPRPTHRLDKATSGVVVVALDRAWQDRLQQAFRAGEARVEYRAIVRGGPPDPSGTVDVALRHTPRSDQGLQPDPQGGTAAHTRWSVKERLRGFTLLSLVPTAGRSHQVRAHLAALGLPALCDAIHGEDDRLNLSELKFEYRSKRGRPERPLLHRPALHARRFVWDDLCVEAPYPSDWRATLDQLRRLRPLA